MVYYDTAKMLRELGDKIPNQYEREFIASCRDRRGILTDAQYNKLLDIFNKYIVVPAGRAQALRNYNY